MTAIVQDAYGSTEVLRYAEIDTPDIVANEVLIKVHAAGLDRGTWHLMTGKPYLMRIMGSGCVAPRTPCRESMWPAWSSPSAPRSPGSSLATRCSASPGAPSPSTRPRERTSWRTSRPT
jgi:hypothetical protein